MGVFILLTSTSVWTQDSNQLITELKEMRNTIYNKEYGNYSKIINYSINILSQKPNSAEAFNVVLLLDKLELNDTIIKNYKDLKDTFFSSIDDLDSNM
ncbi:MAG: hypothetical protein EOM88_04370, partial [Clostridia bacterium]|nr:hypothetical protein [Clostridia bacterium]